MSGVLVPFGRHKGTPVADLEDDALRWFGSLELTSNTFREAVAAELQRRGLKPKEPKPSAAAAPANSSTDALAPVRDALGAVQRAEAALRRFLERQERKP